MIRDTRRYFGKYSSNLIEVVVLDNLCKGFKENLKGIERMTFCICGSDNLRIVGNIDFSKLGCNKMYQCQKCGRYKFYGEDPKDNKIYIEGETKAK
jgi:hypothetical protein